MGDMNLRNTPKCLTMNMCTNTTPENLNVISPSAFKIIIMAKVLFEHILIMERITQD